MKMLEKALEKLACGGHLKKEEARAAAMALLEEDVSEAVIGGLLMALKCLGETADEVAGFAEGMRSAAVPVKTRSEVLVDTCGTGGDGKGTFNISTTAGIRAAGAGVKVAKHGNRAVSSGCGSADVLEALGVDISMGPERVGECIDEVGIGFMFAPVFHPAMKRVMSARKALGVPTIFNILGPLANPAGVCAQVLGVGRERLLELMGDVLVRLGLRRAFVLHGSDGMDEFTLAGETRVVEVDGVRVEQYALSPEDLGLNGCAPYELEGGDAVRNAEITREVLSGKQGPCLDASVANAGFAVLAAGACGSLAEGVKMAREAVENGEAARVLERLVEFSRRGSEDVS